MVLQNDKRTMEIDRTTAEQILYSGVETARFNNSHNMQAYDKLCEKKYSDSNNLQSYNKFEEKSNEPTQAVRLEKYFIEQQEQTAAEPIQTEKYFTNDNPLNAVNASHPYSSFRPKIFGANLEEMTSAGVQQAGPACLQQIAEVHLPNAEETSYSVREDEEETENEPENFAAHKLRLNAKGIVAVVSFFAVIALVIVMIIVTSVSIGGANGRINALKAANAGINAKVVQSEIEQDRIYDIVTKEIEKMVKEEDSGYSEIKVEEMPDIPVWKIAGKNSDRSTNFFDKLSRFFSGMF